jgi:hypothetical protein
MEDMPTDKNKELYQAYRERVGALIDGLEGEELDAFLHERALRASSLRQKYGDTIQKYTLFHALSGSSLFPGEEIIADDLEGQDSIAAFIEELEAKYKK